MFTEDLSAFFDTDEHAVSATYDGDTAVAVIADREFLLQLGQVAGRAPAALVQTSALDADPTGKTLAFDAAAPAPFRSTTFVIRGFEPLDDGAIALVRLETQ